MKPELHQRETQSLSDDVLTLLLDEAERAVLEVESRTDTPDRRLAAPDDDAETAQLRLAIAELVDAYPGVHYELEGIGERLRNIGALAATSELEAHAHIVHLVRMALEVFFRQFPTQEAFENDESCAQDLFDEEALSASEIYETHRQLREVLRRRLS